MVMLPFSQLWGPTGTIMTQLGQVLPGIQLYLLLIAGLLTFFYLRRIKDPESDLKDIFSFVLVIGGISLLVFGNLMVLILVIGMFTGGYMMIHHWMKQSEHTPAAAVQTLQQLHPDVAKKIADLESGMQTLTAKEAKTASEEKRIAHDLATLQRDEATIAAIGEKTARDIASLAKAEMSAEERESAIIKILQEHTQNTKNELGQTHTLPGSEQQARYRLQQELAFIEQQAKELVRNEHQIIQQTIKGGRDLLDATSLLSETQNRAQKLGNIIGECVKHLKPSDAGKLTLADLNNRITEVRKSMASIPASNPELLASTSAKFVALEEARDQAQRVASALEEDIQSIKNNLNQLTNIMKKTGASALPVARKKFLDQLNMFPTIEQSLSAKEQEFFTMIQNFAQSKDAPELACAPLITLADTFLRDIIASREKRIQFNTTLQTFLNVTGDIVLSETAQLKFIDDATRGFEIAEGNLLALNNFAATDGGTPVAANALDAAKNVFEQIDRVEIQARDSAISAAQHAIQEAFDAIAREKEAAQQLLANAGKSHDIIIADLKQIVRQLVDSQTKIINAKAASLAEATKQTNAAANKARAA